MILASRIFLTSFPIIGNKRGLICLNFCLKGFTFSFKGFLCWMIVSSKVLRSSYFHEKISMNSFNSSSYLSRCFTYRNFDNLTCLGFVAVPRLQSVTSASFSGLGSFIGTLLWSKFLSRGTGPFGIWLVGKFNILIPAIILWKFKFWLSSSKFSSWSIWIE